MTTLSALSTIIKQLPPSSAQLRLTADTRMSQLADVFFAYPGANFDPRTQIKFLLAQGVSVVLYEETGSEHLLESQQLTPAQQTRIFAIQNLKQQAGNYARAILAQHALSVQTYCPKVVAITGTNGKTTISHWLSQAFSTLNQPCAAVGTIGVFFESKQATNQLFQGSTGGLTTPDAVSWQQTCFDLGGVGAKWIAVEASSIGLCEHRLSGTQIDTAVFTNLSRDHLDYHGTFEAYSQAKLQLFQWPNLRVAVINHDDPIARIWLTDLASSQSLIHAQQVISYGLSPAPSIKQLTSVRLTQVEHTLSGYRVQIEYPSRQGKQSFWLDLTMFGDYQLSNALAVIATLLGQESETLEINQALLQQVFSNLHCVSGRLEQINSPQQMKQPLVLVDYAHTPDALEKALVATRALSTHRKGKLWVVFGCGGNRDKGKRPLMTQIAATLADHVVLTSDNPRHEKPDAILQDMQTGLSEIKQAASLQIYIDRKQAIETAIKQANANDVILIAGKGHEDYQEIAGIKYPFSDQAVAKSVLYDPQVLRSF